MSSFRETAVPTTCGECGARVLVPHGRPGLRLKCPKCGSVLPAAAPLAPVLKSAPSESAPLGSSPSSAIVPSTDVASEIDALLFGDLAVDTPSAKTVSKPPAITSAPVVPPTEVPRAETPHPGVVAFDSPPDVDEYKLSDELGPLPLPAALPPTAFTPPPHSPPPAHGESEYRLSAPAELSEAATSRTQHVIDAELADDGRFDEDIGKDRVRQGAIGDRILKRKGEKFTPDAALADPRRAFLRGVFEFLFYLEVLPQWFKLAFSLTLELILAWWIVALTLSSSGTGFGGGGIAIGSLLMIAPAILLGFVWIAMTWSVGSAILEDTAAGMKHIENWPESLILDDLPSLVFPAIALFLAALPGVGINWLSEQGVPQIWFLAPLLTAVLFPFALLSILETGSVFVPFSMPVFRCVYKRPGTWLWFYGESTAIAAIAAWASAMLWLRSDGSIWSFSFAAILATAAILLYFRLLGRLALVCANQAYEWTEDPLAGASAENEEHLQPTSSHGA